MRMRLRLQSAIGRLTIGGFCDGMAIVPNGAPAGTSDGAADPVNTA